MRILSYPSLKKLIISAIEPVIDSEEMLQIVKKKSKLLLIINMLLQKMIKYKGL